MVSWFFGDDLVTPHSSWSLFDAVCIFFPRLGDCLLFCLSSLHASPPPTPYAVLHRTSSQLLIKNLSDDVPVVH